MDFERLGVCDELIEAIENEGWERPTDCQEEAIPQILGGGDVLLAAPTGSGKTAAFSIPILQIVYETLQKVIPDTVQSNSLCMNYLDSDSGLEIASNGMSVKNTQNIWKGCRCTSGVSGCGRYYYECRIGGDEKGVCRVGWSTIHDKLNLGMSANGYGYGGSGMKSNKGEFVPYGCSYSTNDVIGCYLDLDYKTVSFTKNGVDLGPAYDNINSSLSYYPTVSLKNTSVTVDFGSSCDFPPNCSRIPCQVADTKEKKSSLLALILEPTRELAEQTYKCLMTFKMFMKSPQVNIGLLGGGENIKPRVEAAMMKNCQIIVATPKRFTETVLSCQVGCLNQLLFFVLDEADELVSSDRKMDVLRIYNRIPARTVENGEFRLQTCMFSATLHSDEVKDMEEAICKNATWIDLKGKDYVPDRIQQLVYYVDVKNSSQYRNYDYQDMAQFTDKVHASTKLPFPLQNMMDISEATKRSKLQIVKKLLDTFHMDRVMIFCRTNLDCNNLEAFFLNAGAGISRQNTALNPYSCVVLAGMRDTESRKEALRSFKEGSCRILICTDVAARGIDIKELPFVINMTLPDNPEQYIHRIGRVGRADAIGLSISIVSVYKEKVWYHTCNKKNRSATLSCRNTHLVSEGGCCIMYDEMDIMNAIEKRIDMKVLPLDDNLAIPSGIDLEAIRKGKNEEFITMAKKNTESIQSNISILAQLEHDTQQSYLFLRHQCLCSYLLKKTRGNAYLQGVYPLTHYK